MIRTVFLGTPQFARHHLMALLNSTDFEVVGVVSQPDRPAGRKMLLQPSPVKSLAIEKNIPTITPVSVNQSEVLNQIQKWNAEVAVVVAFGQLMGDQFLSMFPNKVVNVHASLLPRWRGAAPIQRAIMEGDIESGVALQVMVKKLDAGDIIGVRRVAITEQMDAMVLHDQLMELGCQLIKDELVRYFRGEIFPVSQDEQFVTYAKKIDKSESAINWTMTATQIHQRMRGLVMGPGSFCGFRGKRLKLIQAEVVDRPTDVTQIGKVAELVPGEIRVYCGEKQLRLIHVQPESKPKMSIDDFVRGYQISEGEDLNIKSTMVEK